MTKQELRDTQRDLKQVTNDLGVERTKNAQLCERIAALSRTKHFGNAGVLIGTIVLGVGFDFVKGHQNQLLGLGLSLLGAVLVLVSWFSTPKGTV